MTLAASRSSNESAGAASSAAMVSRARSVRRADPSGEKSVISWSWPGIPAPVALHGSSAPNWSQ